MAIDTYARQLSISSMLVPFFAKGVLPVASISQEDQQDFMWLYRGIRIGYVETKRYDIAIIADRYAADILADRYAADILADRYSAELLMTNE